MTGGLPSQREAETRHVGVGGPVETGMIFVARLMVVVLNVVLILGESPGFVVTFEFDPLVDGKGGNADTRQAEVVGAVVVAGFGMSIGTNGEVKFFGGG